MFSAADARVIGWALQLASGAPTDRGRVLSCRTELRIDDPDRSLATATSLERWEFLNFRIDRSRRPVVYDDPAGVGILESETESASLAWYSARTGTVTPPEIEAIRSLSGWTQCTMPRTDRDDLLVCSTEPLRVDKAGGVTLIPRLIEPTRPEGRGLDAADGDGNMGAESGGIASDHEGGEVERVTKSSSQPQVPAPVDPPKPPFAGSPGDTPPLTPPASGGPASE